MRQIECVVVAINYFQYIQEAYNSLSSINDILTVIYEGNASSIAQLRVWYIKGDKMKHMSPKFFYTRE